MMELFVKKYIIKLAKSKTDATHNYYGLDEDLCKEMCDVNDSGPRFSNNSKRTFSCVGVAKYKGLEFKTATTALQAVIRKNFIKNYKLLKIIGL